MRHDVPMRILFSTAPAIGHLLPLLPLARAARARGHEVVIAGGASIAPFIAAAGFRHEQIGPATIGEMFRWSPRRFRGSRARARADLDAACLLQGDRAGDARRCRRADRTMAARCHRPRGHGIRLMGRCGAERASHTSRSRPPRGGHGSGRSRGMRSNRSATGYGVADADRDRMTGTQPSSRRGHRRCGTRMRHSPR